MKGLQEQLEQKSVVATVPLEARRREVVLAEKSWTGEGLLRVVFTGEDLADFRTLSFDDHIKLIVEANDGDTWGRHYTVRHFERDARRLTIEVHLHAPGRAGAWLLAASRGQRVWVGGPKYSNPIPEPRAWNLLVGDSSALPAIKRRCEEAGCETQILGHVLHATPGGEHAVSFNPPPGIVFHRSADSLLNSLSHCRLPSGPGFAWCAGESDLVADVRMLLTTSCGLSENQLRTRPYWQRGKSEAGSLRRPFL